MANQQSCCHRTSPYLSAMTRQSDQSRALPVPSNRLHRFGKLGGMTAGIAGNMAVNGLAQLGQGQRPSMRNLLLTPRNISRVAEQLAQMRGAAMKIGQLMSMDSGDVLPPELAQIMARLRNDAHFMPPAQLKQVLNAAWRDGWLKRGFASSNFTSGGGIITDRISARIFITVFRGAANRSTDR